MRLLTQLRNGFSQLVFPRVCVCCGRENTAYQRQVCTFCLEDRFADANPENKLVSSDSLLPEGIFAQHALWQFDKGGALQHLLHQLKYQRLTTIGVDLGRKLGHRLYHNPHIAALLETSESVIVPVPLHYLKFRYRGFNQAFMIAQGLQKTWPDMPICEAGDIVRTKNTRTQTGFSLQKRIENMQDAFKVRKQSVVKDKVAVIVDDVFTTGSTTFELAQTLQKAGSQSIIIATVAQA